MAGINEMAAPKAKPDDIAEGFHETLKYDSEDSEKTASTPLMARKNFQFSE